MKIALKKSLMDFPDFDSLPLISVISMIATRRIRDKYEPKHRGIVAGFFIVYTKN